MDGPQFDRCTRFLVTVGSRRRLLGALLGAAVGIRYGAPGDGVQAAPRRCRPSCPLCQTCRKGKCHHGKHGTRCQKGTCLPLPNGSACGACQRCQSGTCVPEEDDSACGADGSGRCREGRCNARPTCLTSSSECSNATTTPLVDRSCCSSTCGGRLPISGKAFCTKSETAQSCYEELDCSLIADTCRGYVCTAT